MRPFIYLPLFRCRLFTLGLTIRGWRVRLSLSARVT